VTIFSKPFHERKTRDQIIEDTVRLKEKGYANLLNDSGGETMWGITTATALANKDIWEKYGFTGDMKSMPLAMAYEIYARDYWGEMYLDPILDISPELAEELFDTGVNCGPTKPQEWLQRCLNVLNGKGIYYTDILVDGDIGPATVAALNGFYAKRGSEGIMVIFTMLNSFQSVHYIEIAEGKESQEDFQYGWQRSRVFQNLQVIL
jgi:lysozyme family protein